jgi:DNA-directed RNA polymerase specialized sigma24 family protein
LLVRLGFIGRVINNSLNRQIPMEDQKNNFVKAYDENADALFRHCLFNINDREAAKDVLQNTFTKTWNYIVGGERWII